DAATEIGTVQAFVPGGATGTFTIEEDASGLFEITAAGVLSLIEGKKMDYGAAQQHTLTVSVNDGTNTRSAVITINVLENMDPTGDAQKFTVAEDIADTDAIGTVVATDPEGDALTFAMKTNDNDLFEITETGELSLAPSMSLDYETAKSHELVVTVNDGTNQVDLTVQVNVTNVVETLFDDPASFITTWKTEIDGEKIGWFTADNYDYNYTIDWGDGTNQVINTSGAKEHTYTTAGTYTVAIKGVFPHFSCANSPFAKKLMALEQWGSIQWQSLASIFEDAGNMVYNATDVPDLAMVTSMSYMFSGATSFNGAIGNWDVINVTDMSFMFAGASAFDQDLSNWDVSNVTNMSGMFGEATAFNQDLSAWGDKLGNVTDMSYMFTGTKAFNQDLSGWGVSNVTTMYYMFGEATAFNQDLSNWDVSNVTDMSQMFQEAIAFNQDLGGWADKLGNVTDMSYMFSGAKAFNQDISGWNVIGVADMSYMFSGASAFDQSLASWNIGNVTDMTGMLDNSGMSPANLNATLIGWQNFVSQNGGPSGVKLGLSGLTTCGPEVMAAMTNLSFVYEWTFDGSVHDDVCTP
uniref:BspA family leucine-rich repeat surface protein n=2 Tax=Flagellimonas beolgyonensis TaxID=864064 RepID=UPI000F8EF499